jgi:hypothetical protein
MKKTTLSLLMCGIAGLILSSCGAKYTPLTEEQKKAKADEIVNTKMADEVKAKSEACAADMQAKVDAKVEEMTKAAQEATAQK